MLSRNSRSSGRDQALSRRKTITAELGQRGIGVVYTAQDPRLKRRVAIKLLPRDLTRDETAKAAVYAK